MNLIDLAQQLGLSPQKVASTCGGEYHSACPKCGGTDRFVLHPNKQMKNCMGCYFCRQCKVNGDAIQFCIDFLGYTFSKAAEYIGANIIPKSNPVMNKPIVDIILPPSEQWMKTAATFIQWAHDNIMNQPTVLKYLERRGIPMEAVKRFKLGWCPTNLFRSRIVWGLQEETDSNGKIKIIWLPKGIVIPTIEPSGKIIRIKIRRADWNKKDSLPKYAAVTGNMKGLNQIGSKKNSVMIVVESELDACSVIHAIGDLAFAVAVGGNTKKADPSTDHHAKIKQHLLICHDNDDPGKIMFTQWKNSYPNAIPCPTPIGKDIGEAIANGLDIRSWIEKELSNTSGTNFTTQQEKMILTTEESLRQMRFGQPNFKDQ